MGARTRICRSRPGSAVAVFASRFRIILRAALPAVLSIASCATAGSADVAAKAGKAKESRRHKVTIAAATIAERRPDNTAWHDPQLTWKRILAGAMLARIDPALARLADLPESDILPSPQVVVSIGAKMELRSFPAYSTLNPRWDWSFVIDERDASLEADITVSVRDSNGGGELGAKTLPIRALLGMDGRHLNDRSVMKLVVGVASLPDDPSPRRCSLHVPANYGEMRHLLAEGAEKPSDCGSRLPVLNGDSLRVIASGKAQILEDRVSRAPKLVDVTPDGPTAGIGQDLQLKPLAGCERFQVGALVAMTTSGCMLVGKRTRIDRVQASGDFVLLVNNGVDDSGLIQNSGGFDAVVEINGEDADSAASESETALPELFSTQENRRSRD